MKATLEFNLPDDQDDFQDAVNGQKWRLMVWDFDQKLRSQLKYNDKLSSEQYKVYEEIRDLLWEKIGEEGLSLDQYGGNNITCIKKHKTAFSSPF